MCRGFTPLLLETPESWLIPAQGRGHKQRSHLEMPRPSLRICAFEHVRFPESGAVPGLARNASVERFLFVRFMALQLAVYMSWQHIVVGPQARTENYCSRLLCASKLSCRDAYLSKRA